MKLLSITSSAPYDQICHAGGKTYNSYIKYLAIQNRENLKISVIAFTREADTNKTDCAKYGIDCQMVVTSGTVSSNFLHVLFDTIGKATDYGKIYSNFKKCCVVRILKQMIKNANIPDVIELEWTDMVLLAPSIRKILPDAIIIGSEHDVSFLSFERYAALAKSKGNLSEYERRNAQFCLVKKMELEAIDDCNIVMPHNLKDAKLLADNGVDKKKIFPIVPYFHNMRNLTRDKDKISHDILFWGAMSRTENIDACLWFIEKVMPLIEDIDVRFIIAGNKPPKSLLDFSSDRIVVTGFVKDETSLFEESMCFVSPLLCGAGIKIKVIEALSSGIPVLTNSIGIEGIPATDGKSFLLCESPEDYANNIRKLYNDTTFGVELGKCGRTVIKDNFELETSQKRYLDMLLNLVHHKDFGGETL